MKASVGHIYIVTYGAYRGLVGVATGHQFDDGEVEIRVLIPAPKNGSFKKGELFPMDGVDRPVRLDTWNLTLKDFLS